MREKRNPLMAFLCALLVLLCCVTNAAAATTPAADGDVKKAKSWTLYHRILAPGSDVATAGSDWSIRGTVDLTVDPSAEESVTLEIKNEENSLTEDFAQALSSASSDSSWYQLKLRDDSSSSSSEIFTSVPACNLRRANFRDEVVLQLHQYSAQALSVTYMTLVSPLAPATCAEYTNLSTPGDWKFESKISWDTAVPGMAVGKPPPKDPVAAVAHNNNNPQPKTVPPPGLKWIPGAVPRKKSAGGVFAPEEQAPEAGLFGFLKRYWYIVLPLILMNVMGGGGGEAPLAAQGGAAGSGNGATAAAAAVGAVGAAAAATSPSSAAGGSPVRRRGKKG